MSLYTTRQTCRLCEGPLEEVVSLGEIHLSTFLGVGQENPPKAPIDLVRCTECDLFQLRHTVNQSLMYSDYWYQSGLNQSMVKALGDVVANVKKRIELKPNDVVVDIGANDGTLLSLYPEGVYKVAIEPSNLAHLAEGKADLIINDYFSEAAYRKEVLSDAKVITAVAMFYDLEDPHSFVADLKAVLKSDGIIVIQMMDLMSMIKLGDFPNLCHEHLEYYSLQVLDTLLLTHNLEIFDVEYNGVNGGSLRVYVRHFVPELELEEYSSVVTDALIKEDDFFASLGDPATFFQNTIELVKLKIVSLIRSLHEGGSRIAVLGASTKGNTTLQYFGLSNHDIDHAAEVNPDKFGLRTVGSNIPIISEDESLKLNPDYYLILPWGFIDYFVEKHKDGYLANGGAFIVPLPVPRIITAENGEINEWDI